MEINTKFDINDKVYVVDNRSKGGCIIHSGLVGKITTEQYGPGYYYETDLFVTYMVDTTGVGCGVVWGEESLFHTREEAEQACRIIEGDMTNEKEV